MRNIVEILVVLAFFVLPSVVFVPNSPSGELTSFSLLQIFYYSLLCAFFVIRNRSFSKGLSKSFSVKKWIHFVGISVFVLIFLFANGFLWQKCSGLEQNYFTFSDAPFAIVCQILGIFVFAFFEESLYRYYLPNSLLNLIMNAQNRQLNNQSKHKTIAFNVLIELSVILLFSFAHRYMGIFAVLNAFFSGIALRLFAKKTPSILFCVIVHFLYNLFWYVI